MGAADPEVAPDLRARRIEQRLTTLLAKPESITRATVENADDPGADVVIRVSGVSVVTVSQADAEDNVTSLDALAQEWAVTLDRALAQARERRQSGWAQFVAAVETSIRTVFSRLGESTIRVVPGVFAAVLVIALFWGVATSTRALMRVIFRRVISDLTVENLIQQIAYYTVWAIGIFVAADAIGFEPRRVIAGLGLTGLALGFALKDILSNFVSGLLILFLRPFEIGDQISIDTTEGSVERIDLRATQIRTYDGRLSLVPNADLLGSRMINNTASPQRRGTVEIFVGYDLDLPAIADLVVRAAGKAEGVLPLPPPSVVVTELGADDVQLQVRFWSDSRRSDFVATSSAVRAEVLAALKEAGTPLPEPNVRVLVDGSNRHKKAPGLVGEHP